MSNTFCWFTSNPFSVTNLNLSCNVTSLLWSISYLVSNQSVVPTKRTNHVELSHQLNSLVHSCTVYKSRWQGTNWRLSMALASVTQISTKCLYFPCLIKKSFSFHYFYFTANVLFQGLTIFHFVWQFLYELRPRTKRKVHVCFCMKKYFT